LADLQLRCRELKRTVGVFKGLSQWLGLRSQNVFSPIRSAFLGQVTSTTSSRDLFVLTEDTLQRWSVPSHGSERLLYEVALHRAISDFLHEEEERKYGGRIELFVRLLDMQPGPNNDIVYVLVASMIKEVPRDRLRVITYTIQEVCLHENGHITLNSTYHIPFEPTLEPESEDMLLNRVSLLVLNGGPSAYVFWPNQILLTKVPQDERPVDVIRFQQKDEYIIGHGPPISLGQLEMNAQNAVVSLNVTDGALFLSPRYGIIVVSQPGLTTLKTESRVSSQRQLPTALTTQTSDISTPPVPFVSLSKTETIIEQIANAFTAFCHRDEKYRPLVEPLRKVDINEAIVIFSLQIVDAKPTSDPRWAEDSANKSSVAPLLLRHQIEEKKRKYQNFLQFLQANNLWELLNPTTRLQLIENAEKLTAASALRTLQNAQEEQKISQELLLRAMSMALAERGISPISSRSGPLWDPLTVQDAFYANISKIEDILKQIQSIEKTIIANTSLISLQEIRNRFELVRQTNQIFETILISARTYRTTHKEFYSNLHFVNDAKESLIPWTSSSLIRSLISEQIAVTIQHVMEFQKEVTASGQQNENKNASDDNETSNRTSNIDVDILYSQIYHLGDVILDGYKEQLTHLSPTVNAEEYTALAQKYDTVKKNVITPLLNFGKFDLARELAEKYKEFNVLVTLTERMNDNERLHYYMKLFKDDGFPTFLFHWLLLNGKKRKLLEQSREYWNELEEFLRPHPELHWIHLIHMGKYETAFDVLISLARSEETSALRKKILLSLAKISNLATGKYNESDLKVQIVEQSLYLLRAQEKLANFVPSEILSRPLSAAEIVSLCLGLDEAANEKIGVTLKIINRHHPQLIDFLVAVDIFKNSNLLRSVAEGEALQMAIIQRAIQIDNWMQLAKDWETQNLDDMTIEVEVKQSIFYKLFTQDIAADFLSVEVFTKIVEDYALISATVVRLLQIAYNLIQQHHHSNAARDNTTPMMIT